MNDFSIWVRKWWPGVLPLALVWAAAVWTTTAPVEKDLGAGATAALKDTVLDKAQIEVSGRDVRFAADAFSEEGRHSAVAQVEAVSGVRLVHNETRLIPEAKPFVWSAERDVVRITLNGSAPLPAIKSRLMDAARAIAAGSDAADNMMLSRGAPPRFDAAALLLVDQVGKLKEGKVTLTDTAVSLAGMARELGSREAIAAALKNLPDGYTVAENAIAAPPYVFQANNDPVAMTLTLNGYVPDNNVHAAIVAAVARKFISEKVVDNLKASVGAPQGFANAVTQALGGLSRLSTGSLTISDRDVKLSGDALYPAASEQIQIDLASSLPQGWKANAEISVKPVASPVDSTVCQQLFVEMLTRGKIRFESGRATIDSDSMGLLDRLIETALRCPTANLEIAGHTDSDGDTGANLALSTRRAQSVVDYLVKAGLPKDRVVARGYGDTKPVVPNDTEENKAKNRRIDFVVR
ncbi:MAG: OmpA family protein [Xanthobacteraceae bacterium]|nr:OmpA family protein [Xanthobacteraceae bacterium]